MQIRRNDQITHSTIYSWSNAILEKNLYITSSLIQKDLYLWNVLSY